MNYEEGKALFGFSSAALESSPHSFVFLSNELGVFYLIHPSSLIIHIFHLVPPPLKPDFPLFMKAVVTVMPKPAILDPAGVATARAMEHLGL